jgi:hypothetical protein
MPTWSKPPQASSPLTDCCKGSDHRSDVRGGLAGESRLPERRRSRRREPDWDWQRGYIELLVDSVSSADWSEPEQAKAAVVARMKEHEPTDELQFLMELSVEPVAAKLGVLSPSAR